MTSIIILTYNQLEYTKMCIESVWNNTKNMELIIVDNNSTDGTVEWLMKNMSGRRSKEIFLKKNYGFPAGNNKGFKSVDENTEYICVINNDVIVTPYWLDRLITHSNRFDVVGACTNYVIGKQREILDIYNNNDELNTISEKFYQDNAGKYEDVNWIVGYCMLIKKSVIDDIGLFDEIYGLGHYEDIDFCMRAKKAGYKIGIAEDVYIHHFGTITWSKRKELKFHETINKSKEIFIKKWGEIPEQ